MTSLSTPTKLLSPSLIFNEQKRTCHLSVPFECHPPQREGEGRVVSVDLGINTTATVAVVNFDGTVTYREFIHPARDIDEVAAAARTCVQRNGDRRDKRLKSVSKRASKTMGLGGSLQKGFCSHTYRKCRNINRQIGQIVSKRIVQIAQQFNADAIVFENLKGWKAKGGRKRSNLRQRFHGWLKGMIRDLTEMKWQEIGGKVIDVVAPPKSWLMTVVESKGRDSKNYALAKFSSGKRYNADLNGALNIAARGILQLTRRKDSEEPSIQRSRAIA
ncbi:IS200/IS605 family accessory protein TnpB-related protein [Arthrospira platensis]|uniref:IS200/IS605 family accessory protein TnpB-related protein n=2 Tax=Limnospira platensis TaxID=118562 RepID=UPI000AD90ED4